MEILWLLMLRGWLTVKRCYSSYMHRNYQPTVIAALLETRNRALFCFNHVFVKRKQILKEHSIYHNSTKYFVC